MAFLSEEDISLTTCLNEDFAPSSASKILLSNALIKSEIKFIFPSFKFAISKFCNNLLITEGFFSIISIIFFSISNLSSFALFNFSKSSSGRDHPKEGKALVSIIFLILNQFSGLFIL